MATLSWVTNIYSKLFEIRHILEKVEKKGPKKYGTARVNLSRRLFDYTKMKPGFILRQEETVGYAVWNARSNAIHDQVSLSHFKDSGFQALAEEDIF